MARALGAEIMKTPVRFEVLDALRGIAALLVAVFHFNALHHAALLPFVRNSYLFVDFFFVLSGFVIAHAYAGRLNSAADAAIFVVRRFGRVWPMHVAVLLAFAVIECQLWLSAISQGVAFVPFGETGQTPLSDLPYHLTMTSALGFVSRLTWNGPSWSIVAEFWTYLIFAAVTLAVPRRWCTGVLVALACASLAILIVSADRGMDASFGLGLPRCICGFVAGIMVFEFRRGAAAKISDLNEYAVIALVVAFVTIAGLGPLSFLAPFVFAIAVYVFSFEQGPVSRWLRTPMFQTLGRRSYSIYMVHAGVLTIVVPAITVLYPVGPDPFIVHTDGARFLTGPSPFVFDALLVFYVFAIVVLSGLTQRNIEEPGQRFFNRLAGGLGTRLGENSSADRVMAT